MFGANGRRVRRGWLVAALVAALLGADRAAATRTFTAPLRNVEGDEIACAVLNHSTQNVMVSAVLRDIDGVALESVAPVAVAPGELESLIFNSDSEAAVYCQFDFTGDDAAIRGLLLDFDSGNGNTRLLAAASEVSGPAQTDVTVHSTPVVSGPSDLIACIAQNVGLITVEVTARLRDSSGGLLAESTIDVDGFHVRTIVSASDPPGATYCEFVFAGNPTVLRGYARISDSMGGNTRFLAAANQAAAAGAPTLHTAAIAPDGGVVHCGTQNLDDQAVAVEADLLDADGALIASADASVQPGEVAFLTNTAVESASPVSCRFTVAAEAIVRPFAAFIEPTGGLRLFEPASATDGPAGLGATSFTPPLRSVDGSEIECWLHNLTAAPVEIDAALVNPTGGVVTEREATIQAGDVRRVVHSPDLLFGAHCRFTFTGSAASIRGHIVLNDGSPRQLHAASIALPLTPLPTATATATRTATRTPTATASSTVTRTPTRTATGTPTASATPTPTSTATAIPTGTATRTPTPTASSSATPTSTPTAISTGTATRTPTATASSSATPTGTATAVPTGTATRTPTATPSSSATPTPTAISSATATRTPTATSSSTTPPTPTATPTTSATRTPTATSSPTASGAATATAPNTPTATPSGGTDPSPTVTLPAASPTATPAPGSPGDANCDGTISAADLTAVIATIASGAAPVCGEDANQDGVVNAADLERITALMFGAAES